MASTPFHHNLMPESQRPAPGFDGLLLIFGGFRGLESPWGQENGRECFKTSRTEKGRQKAH
jgi:hypothetical protein